MPAKQTNAIAAAQNLVALQSQLLQLYSRASTWLNDYNQNIYDNQWSAMPTVTVTAEGLPAATNDATVNLNNPINVPVGSPLLLSRSQLVNGVTLLQKLQTFMTQAGGTMPLSTQTNLTTAAQLAPNTAV